jgi:vacuolar-type H+-ATPase subunit E/Vma4
MAQSHEDALIEEIIGDAKKKAGRTVRRAEREANQALEKAEREAESIRQSTAEAARQRAEKEGAIVLASVDLDTRRIQMGAEERLITEVFDRAWQQALDKQAYDYQSTVTRLVSAAAQAIGGSSFHVALSKEDRASLDIDAIRRSLREQLGRDVELEVNNEPAAIQGGVIVRSGDGRRIVDNSFEGRLGRMRDDLRRRAAEVLLGGKAAS